MKKKILKTKTSFWNDFGNSCHFLSTREYSILCLIFHRLILKESTWEFLISKIIIAFFISTGSVDIPNTHPTIPDSFFQYS